MKHFLTVLAAVAWVCVSSAQAADSAQTSPADTQPADTQPATRPAATRPAEDDTPLPRAYEVFVRELEMSSRQVVRLRREVRQTAEKLDAWDAENAAVVAGMQRELVEAHRAGDRESVAVLQDRLAKLQKDRREILDAHEKAFVAILSPKQKQQYGVLLVTADALDAYSEMKLNDRQVDVIKTLSAKAHERIEKAGDDKSAVDAAYEQLYQDIESRVLTAEQLQTLKKQREGTGGK